MTYFYILTFAAFVLVLRGLFLSWKTNSDLTLKNQELSSKLNRDFEETLDIATSEQLLKELRVRKGIPYILLLPIKEKDFNGITIESHCINQFSCFAMLHLAKAIAVQNLKKNGVDPPKLPPLSDYFSD